MDKYLVTNAQFKKFTDANPEWRPDGIRAELHNGNYLKHGNEPDANKADHPVVNVSWYAAVAYRRWAGKCLPTEAEWEHAARGGLRVTYPWGDEPVDKSRANYSGSGIGTTTAVGRYPENGYGLFDMAGNVWEFVADKWAPYPSTPQKNSVAGGNLFLVGTSILTVKSRRVIRGRPSCLGTRDFVGFRCAKVRRVSGSVVGL